MPFFSSSLMQRFATPLGAGGLQGHEYRTVIFVAISFQMVFTGYRPIQNLQSSLNEEHGLGVISLGVLYAAWIFSGFLTPVAVRFLSTKGVLMVSWVCHVVYTACSFYPAWELTIPASFLVGIFSAPLWTSQSLYITACGFSIARHARDSPYHIFSRLNGIFFAIYETSQITGNVISSAVLQSGVGNRTEKSLFHHCGRMDCPTAHNATDFEEPEQWVIDVLLIVYISFNVIGLLTTYIFVMPLPKSDWSLQTSSKQTVTSFFVTLRRTAIGLLVPMFVFQGMQQAILFSEFTRSYISCPLGIHMVGFVMATHGVVTPFTTWLFSRVVKLTGRYVLFVLAGGVNLGLMMVMVWWTPDVADKPFIFLAPIAWGVSEGIWLTQSNSLIAVQFSQQKEPAFAVYHTCRSVGLALTLAYSRWLCASVKLTIGIVFVLLGLLLYTVFEYRIKRREKLAQKHANSAVSGLALHIISGLPGLKFTNENSPPRRLESFPGEPSEEDLEDSVFSSSPVQGEFVFPGVSPEEQTVQSRLPSVASSSAGILSTLSVMASLNLAEEDEFIETLPAKTLQRLSASLSEPEEKYF